MGDDSETRKPTISARVPKDTYDRLEAYCEENEISKADALRRFTEDGLARNRVEDELADRMGLGVDPGTIGAIVVIVLLLVIVLQNAGVI